jgi:hypothetical protein
VKIRVGRRHFTIVTLRASPTRWALLFSISGCVLLGGCATAPASAPADRYSPAEMKNGPSLYETGRFAVVQPSSGGLRIDEGAIGQPSAPRPARARTSAKRKARAHAQRTP